MSRQELEKLDHLRPYQDKAYVGMKQSDCSRNSVGFKENRWKDNEIIYTWRSIDEEN